MPDTHDERGGATAMLTAIRRRALTASTYAEWHQVGRDVETLAEQLATATAELGRVNKRADFLDDALDGMRQQAIEAVKERNEATARAEKAEARIAELGTATTQWAWTDPLGTYPQLNETHARLIADFDSTRSVLIRETFVGPWRPDPKATDGAGAGLSTTETDGDGVRGSVGVSTPVRASAGPSEPEPCDGDCDCDCQPGQPCLCPERDCYCGPCPVCGDNPQQTDDDTTEGR